MTFDYAKIASQVDKDPSEVKSKVDKYAAEIKKELEGLLSPDTIDAEVEKVVLKNLNKVFKLSGLAYAKEQAEKGNISTVYSIILGVSPAYDRNSYKKWQAREEWKKDPKGSVKAGLVREAISKNGNTYAIALDHESIIKRKDQNGVEVEQPNPNYGKDIPDNYKVSIPMIITGVDGKSEQAKFITATMSWDKDIINHPDIGKQSTVYGRFNGEYFTVSKDAHECGDIYKKAFDVAAQVMPTTELWMDLVALDSTPVVNIVDGYQKNVYTKFATKGTVQKVDINELKRYDGTPYLKASIRIGDSDVINGIKLSTAYENTVAYISDNIQSGDDVIVVGQKKSFAKKEGDNFVLDDNGNKIMVPYYELWGVVKEFNSDNDALLARLREKGLI